MELDTQLFYALNNLTGLSSAFDTLVIFFASYLQYILGAIFLLLLYAATYSKQEKFYLFLTTVFSAIISRFGVTELIRFFYHRQRPFFALDGVNNLFVDHNWSFPSGHSAFFFAMATAIYFYNKKWGVWFFIAAFFMNISRVVAGVHYPSDIVGGMIIGILTALAVHYCVTRARIVKSKQ